MFMVTRYFLQKLWCSVGRVKPLKLISAQLIHCIYVRLIHLICIFRGATFYVTKSVREFEEFVKPFF